MNTHSIGIFLITMGIIFLLGKMVPFVGHLPGDIWVHGKNWRVFLPVGTFLVGSIILSIVIRLIGR